MSNTIDPKSRILVPDNTSNKVPSANLNKLLFVIPIILGLGLLFASSIGGVGLFAHTTPQWLQNIVTTVGQPGPWTFWTMLIGGGVLGLGGVIGGICGLAKKNVGPTTHPIVVEESSEENSFEDNSFSTNDVDPGTRSPIVVDESKDKIKTPNVGLTTNSIVVEESSEENSFEDNSFSTNDVDPEAGGPVAVKNVAAEAIGSIAVKESVETNIYSHKEDVLDYKNIFIGLGPKCLLDPNDTKTTIQTFTLLVDLSGEQEFTQEFTQEQCEKTKNNIFTAIDAFMKKFGVCVFNIDFYLGDDSNYGKKGFLEIGAYGYEWYKNCFVDLCYECSKHSNVRNVTGKCVDSKYMKQEDKEWCSSKVNFSKKLNQIFSSENTLPLDPKIVDKFDRCCFDARMINENNACLAKDVGDSKKIVIAPIRAMALSK